MMTKIVVGDLHDKLATAGIPLDGLALLKDGSIRVDYKDDATPEHKTAAQTIINVYDQDIVDSTKVTAVTLADIEGAKTVNDLKALLVKMLNDKA